MTRARALSSATFDSRFRQHLLHGARKMITLIGLLDDDLVALAASKCKFVTIASSENERRPQFLQLRCQVEARASADIDVEHRNMEKLLRQEMYCDQRKAESCIVAARSYEAGSTGVTDPEKASKYRRIALTVWISQCDRNSSLACATLATMYRAGSGVPQSDRNADALFARARELCRFNDAPVCHELPKP